MNTSSEPLMPKESKSRIGDADHALRIINRLKRADSTRAQRRVRVSGLVDGNPPIPESKLIREGQAGRSNFNSLEADGHVSARVTSYYALVMDCNSLVNVKMAKPEMRTAYGSVDVGEKIGLNVDRLLKSWPGFYLNMMLHENEMVTHGIGPVIWTHQRDFRFTATEKGAILVSDSTSLDPDRMEYFVHLTEYSVSDLYFKVFATSEEIDANITDEDKAKAAADEGWNVKEIKRLIQNACREFTGRKSGPSTWESLQNSLRDGDLGVSENYAKTIDVGVIYCREFNGKVSQMIVATNGNAGQSKKREFIKKSVGVFDSFRNTSVFFANSIGRTGTYHSVKGHGQKIYNHCVVNDRLKNAIVDGVQAMATIFMSQQPGSGNEDGDKIKRVGPYCMLPSGYSIVQWNGSTNIGGIISVSRMLEQGLANNVGLSRPDLVDKNSESPLSKTLGGERLRMMREGRLENTETSVYYLSLDSLYSEVVRRVLSEEYLETDPGYDYVKKFKEWCKADSIPDEALKFENLIVTATRAIGSGSPAMRVMITEDILSMSPYLPEAGRNNAITDRLNALGGQAAVERYGMNLVSMAPSNETSIATLENNALRAGGSVVVGRDQAHIDHLQVVVSDMMRVAQAFIDPRTRSEVDVQSAYTQMTGELQHASEHLDYLRNDPFRAREYNEFFGQVKQLMDVYAMISKAYETAAEDQRAQQEQKLREVVEAQNGEVDAKTRVAMQKLQNDLVLGMQREENSKQLRTMKTQHMMALKDAMVQQKMDIDAMRAAKEMNRTEVRR